MMMAASRVAVIVTGHLRLRDEAHLIRIQEALEGGASPVDCFVVTSPEHARAAAALTAGFAHRTLLLNRRRELRALRGGDAIPANLWQWLQLERGMAHWRATLLEANAYDTLVRFRTDVALPKAFHFSDCRAAEALGTQPDQAIPGVGSGGGARKGGSAAGSAGDLPSDAFHGPGVLSGAVGVVFARSDYLFYTDPLLFYGAFASLFSTSRACYAPRDASLPEEAQTYTHQVEALGGLAPLCLEASVYSPEPRERPLLVARQFPTAGAPSSNYAEVSAAVVVPRETPFGPEADRLVCGCRFFPVVPGTTATSTLAARWKQARASGGRFQSEAAFSYQVLALGAACLPLDLPHREAFELMPQSAAFTFGVDSPVVVARGGEGSSGRKRRTTRLGLLSSLRWSILLPLSMVLALVAVAVRSCNRVRSARSQLRG
jgi:hypothetical protein